MQVGCTSSPSFYGSPNPSEKMRRKLVVTVGVAIVALSFAALCVSILGSSGSDRCSARVVLRQRLIEAVSQASTCSTDSDCVSRFGPVDVPEICNMCLNRNFLSVVEISERAYLQGCFMAGNCTIGTSECVCRAGRCSFN